MSRKAKAGVAIPEIKKKERNEITETRTYKLITPLYGGGVEPEKSDPITVVRASEVRGHLRFWWRATRGGAFDGSLKKMREREEEIFGSAAGEGKAGQSKVSIRIINAQKGDPIYRLNRPGNQRESVEIGDPRSPWGYAAFPLRAENNKPAGAVTDNVTFTIEITFPDDLKTDIEMTLWAWECFGGIGARTRRGFGALALEAVDNKPVTAPTKQKFQEKLKKNLLTFESYTWHKSVPRLSVDLDSYRFISVRQQDDKRAENLDAWIKLFSMLKKFRQARYQDGRGRPYGRSKWPEADQIRRLVPTHSPGHEPEHPVKKFPRSQFGLPIIFKFKDEDVEHGDPQQSELNAKKYERLASPLILRPFQCTDGVIGIATVLDTPKTPPDGLMLKMKTGDKDAEGMIKRDEAQKIPMLNGEKDILKAFLDYLN